MLYTSQCVKSIGASGSLTTIAKVFVRAGAGDPCRFGDTLPPSDVYRAGICPPSEKLELLTCEPESACPSAGSDSGSEKLRNTNAAGRQLNERPPIRVACVTGRIRFNPSLISYPLPSPGDLRCAEQHQAYARCERNRHSQECSAGLVALRPGVFTTRLWKAGVQCARLRAERWQSPVECT